MKQEVKKTKPAVKSKGNVTATAKPALKGVDNVLSDIDSLLDETQERESVEERFYSRCGC